ncbi:MAG: hypothetical protein ABGY96_12475 [bacterium]|nr:hypothetical protein [Gammaproteobacteria bacterium]HIL96770.1 hypothetical protein [Pseudomonadales bacterium]
MNWEALGALAEIVGAAAVVITLLYLAIQVRHSNRQTESDSLRHTWDSGNELINAFSASIEIASIVNRGRESFQNLDPDEQLIFELLHVRVLNLVESWHHQTTQTLKESEFRDTQIENINGVIVWFFSYLGSAEVWNKVRHMFVPIQNVVDSAA